MAKSKETFNKREKEKKRLKQKQEKREKMQERKANASKGKSLDDMIAYIDEDGNISSTPPDPRKRRTFDADNIQISVPRYEADTEEVTRQGIVSYFNDQKGFGFIHDAKSGERVFVHVKQLAEPVAENDKVIFEVESGDRGQTAVNVRKLAA